MTEPNTDPQDRPEAEARSARRALAWLAIIGVLVLAAAIYAGGVYGRLSATADLKRQGMTEANLKVALLRAVLERPRALPLVLSQDRDIVDMLGEPQPAAIDRVNRKLESLVGGSQVSVIYVIAPSGQTIASSNWRQADSFIGSNYGFRDYFRNAMATGVAEQFALGNVSRRPGLYISRRIDGAGRSLGVVVVKMEFDRLEADWRDSGRPALVVDGRGVALITTVPNWRFMTMATLPEERIAAIRESLQFGDAPLTPLPFRKDASVTGDNAEIRVAWPDGREISYLRLRAQAPTTPWVLEYLVSTDPVPAAARQNMLAAFALFAPLIALLGVVFERRRRATARLAAAQAQRAALESRVEARTRDLTLARDRLEAEIADHHDTEKRLQVVQQDLVAANRLAILGQVAAGVAHEINQPVATIRAYADNARVFLDRGSLDKASGNMEAIAGLTERIGAITEDLKALARKGRGPAEAVSLSEAMDGALMLLKSRFSHRLDALTLERPEPDIRLKVDRIRLEQVLINLMQNALEAIELTPEPRVIVRAEDRGGQVAVQVSDNGPGIAPDILEQLFTPFNTSKPRGLGLGLVISKEILRDYGGEISVETGPTGSCFTIHLSKDQA
ncbi:two-component system C4-dicarboxylate transport sensor histidine kinase DctB [Rhizobium sp. SG_E_25_P2]|uniref:sensor histidine kinase n=1 Tax=Rhizobium sp. SG_E_25_P2 TaxID=2879942 RepID=UPI0024760442|nr:ATP-binding protein [Rhizobium sp. SG_E_25_P2]MDH6265136.1 two-component system C4-dicarboxylate transport sensor histidine kinase DctB [Rhizobium sp. SG_E_25_P2]